MSRPISLTATPPHANTAAGAFGDYNREIASLEFTNKSHHASTNTFRNP
jgi:hypothetical protein